jgi:hypothetical protein
MIVAVEVEERGSLWSLTCSDRRAAIRSRDDHRDSRSVPPTDCDDSSILVRLFVAHVTGSKRRERERLGGVAGQFRGKFVSVNMSHQ